MPTLREHAHSWLRRLEQITKTDMVYLAKGSFWVALGTGIASALGLLISVVYANYLTKEVYGQYRYILSLFAILNTLTLTGMNTAVTQAVARGKEGVLKHSFVVQLRWGLLLFVMAAGIGIYYLLHGNQILGISFLAISLLAPISNSANTFQAYLQGKKDFRAMSQTSTFIGITTTAIIALAVISTRDVIILVLANFISTTLLNVACYYWTLHKYKPNAELDDDAIKYGKHLTILGVLGAIAAQLDSILLFQYLGAAQVAIFNFALMAPDQIKSFSKIIAQIALPKFAEKDPTEIRRTIFPKILQLAILMGLLMLAYIAAAPLLFHWFFPQYADSVVYTRWYALSLIFSVSQIPATILLAQRNKHALVVFSVGGSLIQIIASAILIPWLGIAGAIWAKNIGQGMNLLLSIYLVKRQPTH